jgi:hypothetical protein
MVLQTSMTRIKEDQNLEQFTRQYVEHLYSPWPRDVIYSQILHWHHLGGHIYKHLSSRSAWPQYQLSPGELAPSSRDKNGAGPNKERHHVLQNPKWEHCFQTYQATNFNPILSTSESAIGYKLAIHFQLWISITIFSGTKFLVYPHWSCFLLIVIKLHRSSLCICWVQIWGRPTLVEHPSGHP